MENNTPINGGFGNCVVLFGRFSNCMSITGQVRQLRRDGEGESCGDLFSDYSSCLMAQVSKDENRQRVRILLSAPFDIAIL